MLQEMRTAYARAPMSQASLVAGPSYSTGVSLSPTGSSIRVGLALCIDAGRHPIQSLWQPP